MSDDRNAVSGMAGSVLEKYAGVSQQDTDAASGPPARQHGCYSEHATDLRMLDLHLVDGDRVAFPYHFLEEIRYSPSNGITLVFSGCRVEVGGSSLETIYRGLLGHRIGHLAVAPSSPAASMTPVGMLAGEASIRSIKVMPEEE